MVISKIVVTVLINRSIPTPLKISMIQNKNKKL